ncbi:MAG TPA: glycosyltransferase family 4 protein [Euryarchaeota archaeon]|nr:glycosyltransferase family 4 protein [Euryarchaeota archaeon]
MEQRKGIRILMIGPMGDTGGVATHTRALTARLREMGDHLTEFNTLTSKGWRPGRKDPLTLLDHVVKVLRLSTYMPLVIFRNRNRVDIVHIQSSGPLGGFLPAVMGTFCTSVLGLRSVITFHYSKTDRFVKDHPGKLRKVIARSSAFIVVSGKQKDLISGVIPGKDRSKLVRIPNGFDRSDFPLKERGEARKELGIGGDELVMSNIAWIMEKKGHIFLLEALRRLREDVSKPVRCFIMGKGPLLDEMRERTVSMGLSDAIEFTGFVDQERMVTILNASDMFVLPSLNEGNPIVMFEALGMGLPYVGTDVGGVSEIIVDGRYGILCPPGDAEALYRIIREAADREWDREEIIRYSGNFTWERIAMLTRDVYESIVEREEGEAR